jgi:Insertion element 4 transposase N-terminal/Transposase DDE domain
MLQIIKDLAETASTLAPERLERMAHALPEEWIEEALRATGVKTLRRRRIPAEQVIWLVMGMAMIRGRSILEVAMKLELPLPSKEGRAVAPSALAQARQRVGAAPLRWLFEKVSGWASDQAQGARWRGLSVLALDGSTLCVPDSEENARHWGRHRSGKHATPSGYPMLRVVWLVDVHSRLVRAARFGPYATAELTYAYDLLPALPEDSVVIMDRLYHCSPMLLPVVAAAHRHFLVRTKSNAKWRVLRSLGEGDDLVEVTVTDEARAANPSLPSHYTARAVRTRTPKNEYTLLTSMTEEQQFPADEIRTLYRDRWEVELALDELKTKMLEQAPTLRSRTVEGIEQEMWGTLLAYNLVRVEMAAVAREAEVAPRRVSFSMCLRFIVDEWAWDSLAKPGAIPTHLKRLRANLQRFILPPRRSDRSYPRAVKQKENAYPRKKGEALAQLLN